MCTHVTFISHYCHKNNYPHRSKKKKCESYSKILISTFISYHIGTSLRQQHNCTIKWIHWAYSYKTNISINIHTYNLLTALKFFLFVKILFKCISIKVSQISFLYMKVYERKRSCYQDWQKWNLNQHSIQRKP